MDKKPLAPPDGLKRHTALRLPAPLALPDGSIGRLGPIVASLAQRSRCRPSGRRHASDLRSDCTGRCARLTAHVPISGRTFSGPGAMPVPLRWRPICAERAPALPLAVQSLSCDGAMSVADVGVSALSDGSGGSTDAEIIHAAQADARTRRRRLYLAVRQAIVGQVFPTAAQARGGAAAPGMTMSSLDGQSNHTRVATRSQQ